ncbi:MAG: enoyl-CoA hydratase/isomerase family protein [Luminiphilus sp.]|nr:enoyl-CoA hydratase/isomerase family protein [Luminiphilus sp.]
MSTEDVIFFEHPSSDGSVVAEARLNIPSTLNALTLDAVEAMTPKMTDWAERDEVVAVIVTGEGDKAFCAGGDVQALYHAATENLAAGRTVNDYPERFFAAEYRLDYIMHCYEKPLLTLGHGIVMGGGYGLFSASNFRVVTQRTRLAFPEITIGLFPDAGGTVVMRNLPPKIAALLTMTGGQVNATDALALGVGTHLIDHEGRADFLEGLKQLHWQVGSPGANTEVLKNYLAAQTHAGGMPSSDVAEVDVETIDLSNLKACFDSILALEGTSKWMDRGIASLRSGCPVTAGIIFKQLGLSPTLSLAECFMTELAIATNCLSRPDFAEGVRALLIDKDQSPTWSVTSIDDLSQSLIDEHFVGDWEGAARSHPLGDLLDIESAG